MKINFFYPLLLGSFFVFQAQASLRVFVTNNTSYFDYPAAFIYKNSVNGTSGNLAEPISDPTGCKMVKAPYTDWIALVKEGRCSFLTKIKNMQASGAMAIVIGSSDTKIRHLSTQVDSVLDVKIPTIFLASTEYSEVLHWIEIEGLSVNVFMKLDSLDQDFEVGVSILLPLLLVLLGPICVLLLYCINDYICEWHRKRKEVASVNMVSSLTKKTFCYDKLKENETETCVICLEDYVDGDELRILPCNHHYHIFCIDIWLTKQKKDVNT
ncbi:uncharacterized protein BX663DRAFT_491380 [Cokeromyces recurvatus]|uniref:uncharacterized protein n=1 Tax=Cokeromyces recurvatus TaxID=90255 RepID=UPI00221F7A31|nr:uncharacterized protein BX663DRAFT_491380 [Cokeromyces recurvatus]KAI7907586.1 hypothetical protein BX663DRAFT_491380 [Cokeromyces recurvatus]